MRDVVISGNSFPGRRRGKHKDPMAGASSVSLRNSIETRGWSREREGQSGWRGGQTGGTEPDLVGLCRLL